jgi:hypothetical protein
MIFYKLMTKYRCFRDTFFSFIYIQGIFMRKPVYLVRKNMMLVHQYGTLVYCFLRSDADMYI